MRRKSSTSSDVAAGIVFQNPVLLEWRTALGNIMLQAEARKLDRAAAERRACRLQARPRGYLCAGSPACCATHQPPQMRRHAIKLKLAQPDASHQETAVIQLTRLAAREPPSWRRPEYPANPRRRSNPQLGHARVQKAHPIALQHTCLGNVRWPSRIPIFRTAAFECNISELKPRMRSYGGTYCRHCAFNCQGYTPGAYIPIWRPSCLASRSSG